MYRQICEPYELQSTTKTGGKYQSQRKQQLKLLSGTSMHTYTLHTLTPPWLLTHPVPIPTGYIHPYFEAFIAFIKTTRSKNNIKGKPSKQTPKYKILQQPAEQRLLSRKPVWTLAEHSPVRPVELWRAQWEDHVMQRTSSLIWTRVDPCKAVLHQ